MELSCRIDARLSRMERCCLNMNLLLKQKSCLVRLVLLVLGPQDFLGMKMLCVKGRVLVVGGPKKWQRIWGC
jgi:hypothetical protein